MLDLEPIRSLITVEILTSVNVFGSSLGDFDLVWEPFTT